MTRENLYRGTSLQDLLIKSWQEKVVADADSTHLDSLGDTDSAQLPSHCQILHLGALSLKTLKGHSASRCQMTDRREILLLPQLHISLIFFTVPQIFVGMLQSLRVGAGWIVCSLLVHFSASCNFQNYLHFNICLRISFWGNVNEDKLIMSINF